MKRIFAMALIMVFASSFAFASSSSNDIANENLGWIYQNGDREDVLLIETTDTFLGACLADLGVAYDYFFGGDFSALDLSGYQHVILGMDGGLVEEPSIVNAANFANAGGAFHIFGGTCWQPFAIAVNAHLLENNTNDYCWSTVGGVPHTVVTDAGHYLANGLPADYTFNNLSASYYSLRPTDGAAAVAAVNGDGFDHLLSKAIGAGTFDICTNSSYGSYWAGADYDWGCQVVENMLNLGPTANEESSWSQVKSLY
jgi:hypothetical protein